MKTEFERLLDAIGSLETERVELEVELDKAKKAVMHGGSNAISEAAVDRMKERFLKVLQ